MTLPARLRDELRRRTGRPTSLDRKHLGELRWWLERWDPTIRDGGYNPGDVLSFLDGEQVGETYLDRRWQHARAEVRRVLKEAAIDDERFFDGKVVIDIGPGPLGFPDACPARVSIGIEPLAERYREAGLLLPESPAIYLSIGAEEIPLVSETVDVVIARNSLDHVDDPEQVLSEIRRLLAPGGTVILNVDVDHTPTETEPHAMTVDRVRHGLGDLSIVREEHWAHGHGHDGHAVVLVAERPEARG